jgi:hypothetical protein
LGNRRPYRDRTEADRWITERAVVVEAKVKEEQGRPLTGVNGVVCPKKEKREQKINKRP